MKLIFQDDGYSIIETLVALTLIGLLLIMVHQVMPVVSVNNYSKIKLNAISHAKSEMTFVLATKDFISAEKDINAKLKLIREVKCQEDYTKIHIKIVSKKTNKIIYQLIAYE